jgi:hypothetical protein
MGQRINRPAFSQAGNGLNVTAPSNANTTPPGYYMLFILNGNGVPSVASILRIDATLTPAPTPSWTIPITVQTNPAGLTFTVDSSTYNAAQTFSWVPGSSHTITTTSPQSGGTGVRFVWQNWSGGGTISHTVAPTTKQTYTANFGTQYFLTMSHGTGGTQSPASGWRSRGGIISISATPATGYIFSGWTGSGTGSYTGTNNPASITMSGPITEAGAFTQNTTPTPTATPTATPQNGAPVVDAGPDQTIPIPGATLNGSASDDGLPNPPGALIYTWSAVTGPGTVSFADASATDTTASFSQSGVYTLRLMADDGAASSSDDVVVTVNQPPVVTLGSTNAGPALAIALSDPGSLNGSATDDGFPNPPGALTYNWTAVNGPGAVTFADATAASTTATFSSAGSYNLRLTASDSAISGSADLPVLVGGPLPSPWIDQDIGAVGNIGRGSFLEGTFIERGSGADIGGSADAFHYIYQQLNGNGAIIARVATQNNSDPSAKAGVMIRETLSAGSKYAAAVITPSTSIISQRRTKTNGTTASTTATDTQLVVPYWLKLTRTASSLATFYSSDGVTWTSAGSTNVAMGASVFVGLAVTSHSNVFNSTATIDHVNLSPIANAGPDQSITGTANTTTLNGSATDDGQPNGSITYSWKKANGPGKVTFGNASQPLTTAQFSKAGTYTLRLTVNDGQLSATDNVVITVLTPTP